MHRRRKLKKAFIRFLDSYKGDTLNIKLMSIAFEAGWDAHKHEKSNSKPRTSLRKK